VSELRIGFQGERGAYGEEATLSLFGPGVQAVPLPSFRAVFESVAQGRVDGGVVPVENSLAGSVIDNVDLLIEFPVSITGELALHIRHCLLAPAGTALADVERAFSHPQALAQCTAFLRQHGITPVPESDTAGAARRLSEQRTPRSAAIASRNAATLYGLTVLQEGIQDMPGNYTRFVALGALPSLQGARSKTAIVLTVENVPGALHRVLGAFATRGLDIIRLETRPLRRRGEYYFCLDLAGAKDEPALAAALSEAERACSTFRVLGSYRVAD
jgi:prephenate dehydratase